MSNPFDRISKLVSITQDSEYFSDDTQKTIERIIQLHSENALVPIICEDMYEYTNPQTGESQPLQSYIAEEILKNSSKKIELTEGELQDILYGGYYGLSLLKKKIGKDIYQEIFESIIFLGKIRNGIGIKKEVADFLNACNFPLIITTSCFSILESVLEDKEYKSVWYIKGEQNNKTLEDKTIYHLFCQAAASSNEWGHSEKELLEILKSLVSNDYAPKNLKQETGKKLLLVLGNNTTDWLFRLILSPIWNADANKKNGYYFINNQENIDKRLELCLQDFNFDTERKMLAVLKGVTDFIQKKGTIQEGIGHNKKYDFFISHSSNDKTLAEQLKILLEKNGLKVWIDSNNDLDGNFWEPIILGIKNSRYFMPLITESFMGKTKKGEIWRKIINDINKNNGAESDCNYLPIDCKITGDLKQKGLEGVMVELLLADSWRHQQNFNVYSIPIIVKDEECMGRIIDATYIDNLGKDSKWLPEGLFHSINSYYYDKDKKDDGLNWETSDTEASQTFKYDNYKSEKRKADDNNK